MGEKINAVRPSAVVAMMVGAVAVLSSLAAVPAGKASAEEVGRVADGPPRLSFPLQCEPGKTCFIQHYVDLDPGPDARDYACGTATYDAHTGTDFRLLSAAAAKSGVPVLASADGTVKGKRDGVPDIFAYKSGRGSVAGQECGNGVVLDHGNGWETQYCHMRQGSVLVSNGQTVKRSDALGLVGYSGLADFAHLHLSVRHNGRVVDPFSGEEPGAVCHLDPASVHGLWDATAEQELPYANGNIVATGFAGKPPDLKTLEEDHELVEKPSAAGQQLLFYARFINLRKGDVSSLKVRGPLDFDVDSAPAPLDHSKATFLSYTGKKAPPGGFAKGPYFGHAKILRNGKVIAEQAAKIELE